MYIRIGKPKQIADLKILVPAPIGTLRSQISIVVIDDKGFVYHDVLRNHGYVVTELRDITDIKTIKPYPIVICDIRGVGKAFGSPYEGAHVLSEIRKHYPDKVLIVYTGQLFDASFNKYFVLCDASITKDAESQQWIEVLDSAITSYLDPVAQWKKIRAYLSNLEVPTIRLAELEHQYVTALLAKQKPFVDENKLFDLPKDAKTVLLGIASNIAFKLLTSGI